MESLVGKLLLGRYQVVESIGRGGMAEVYKVWDQKRATHLAMKLLRDDMAEDRVFLRRFKREAQTLANLQHPNIVRFYGMEQEDLLAFILMDYVEGHALRTEIFRLDGTPMRADRIRSILQPVCSGLHYAHSMGMVHCDLKPANIMIDKHGRVMLTDFGIARMTDAATATMVGAGTPAYMAPEQARGLEPLPQTDIYALGVVLFEMLSGGERPFMGQQATTTGSTSEKVRWEQINLQPPSPRRWNPDISPELDAIVLKCLSKQPEERFRDSLELNNAVEMVVGMDDGVPVGETIPPGIQPPVSHQVVKDSSSKEKAFTKKYPPDSSTTPWWKKPVVWVGISLVVIIAILFGLLSKPTLPNTAMDLSFATPRFTATAIPTLTSTPNPNFNIFLSDFGLSLGHPKEWVVDEYEGYFYIALESDESQMVGVFGLHISQSEIQDGETDFDIPGDMDIYSPNDWVDIVATDIMGAGKNLQDHIAMEVSGYSASQARFHLNEDDESYQGFIIAIIVQNDVTILLFGSDETLWTESQAVFEEMIGTIQIDLSMASVPTAPSPAHSGFVCDDLIGCVTYGPDDPIRLASALVISGPNADLGLDSQYGVEIAIDFQGNLLGHQIELQTEDDGCSAVGGQAAGQKIVSDPSIVAVVGTSCSGAGVPMSEIISEAGYVMISPSNTAPSLTDPGQAWNPGYLRVSHNDKVQGWAMAEFAYNILGVVTAAAIHDGDPYTEGLALEFANHFETLGGTIVEFTAVNKGDTDMRPVLSAVAAAGPPEFLYYPIFTAEGAFLTHQTKIVSGLENTILAAADGLISSAAIDALGDAGEGMYFSGPDLSFSGVLYDQFVEKYKERYGTKPLSVFHAHAFDATNMIFACIENVAIQDGDTINIGRQALRNCLYSLSDFEGITGSLSCTPYGDCADPNISIAQLNNGYYERVWP